MVGASSPRCCGVICELRRFWDLPLLGRISKVTAMDQYKYVRQRKSSRRVLVDLT